MNYESMTKEQLIEHVQDVKGLLKGYRLINRGIGLTLSAQSGTENVGDMICKQEDAVIESLYKLEVPYNVAEAYSTQDEVFGDDYSSI